jgi:DNA-binding transcriptional LysR family regulator
MIAKLQTNDLRWDDVRVFLALYRERSLVKAGKRIGVDASTTSRRLAALEAALGARLFDRTRDGMVPTAAGEQIVPAAEEVARGLARLSHTAETFEPGVEGVVRVSVVPGVAEAFVAPRLPLLFRKYPKLCVELEASVATSDLTRREADLAIRTIRPTSGDLILTKLLDTRSIALTSRAYAKALGTVRDWSSVRWIGWERDLAHIPEAQWLAKHAPGVEPALRTNSAVAQLEAAEAGAGAVLLGEAYSGVRALVPVKIAPALAARTEWPRGSMWLVGHRVMRDVPRVAAVWAFIVEMAEVLPKRAPSPSRRRSRV